MRGKQSQPIFTLSEGGVIQKKLTTTQTNSWQTLQQQQQQQPVRKTVKIVRLNPGVTVSRPQSIPATIIPSPLKKSVVSIAPKIVRAQDLKTETIIPATTSLEEVTVDDNEASSGSSGSENATKGDPKEALKRKLREIEAMNEELRRRKEEADELKRQLEEDGT